VRKERNLLKYIDIDFVRQDLLRAAT